MEKGYTIAVGFGKNVRNRGFPQNDCNPKVSTFIGEFWRKIREKAPLTLSRCILKSIKRRDTHNNDRYRIDIAIARFYL